MTDLRIHNVSFSYAGSSALALRSINLTIPKGEFVLLAGPSGCGKSTLALALAGLIPTRIAGRLRGGIYLGDKNVSAMNIHEASQRIGMVFQSPEEQLIHLDVESEVAFGPENQALARPEIERRVAQSLTYTGIAELRKQEIFALSGGQKQRVAISATLAMMPEILVLDEPTSDLDPVGTREVLSVLRTLNKQYGMTIVLVEHKIDEIIPWVDRVLLMDEGRIVVDAPPRSAFDDFQLWSNPGVAIPQVVQLARALPDIFQGATPLSVDEAYDALDPRLKVLYPFVIGTVSVLLNWDFVFLLFALTLIPWLLMRTSGARMRVVFTMIVTPALGLIWSQGLFHIMDYAHPHLIFIFPATLSWFGTPGLSASGLLYGAQQAGRVMAGASASLILLMTTKPSEVIWAFYKFRMPAAVGLAFTTALRFLPQMIERMTVLLQVMQVRGYDLSIPRWWEVHQWPGYISRVFICIPIVTMPLLIGALRSTFVMAMVVDARAFGSHPQRTMLNEHQPTLADRVAWSLLAALVVAAVLLISLHVAYRQV